MINGRYSRPIRSSNPRLALTLDECHTCHSQTQLLRDAQVRGSRHHYDESNSAQKVTLTLNFGHNNGPSGSSDGIGWHMSMTSNVFFAATDEDAQSIPWVQVRTPDGRETTYISSASTLSHEQLAQLPRRLMDCTDCHNRAGHGLPLPDSALDQALFTGEVSRHSR
jgi:hypothetical protein